MFDNEYEYDYDRIVEDTDELYDQYDDFDDADDEYDNDVEWDNYYHNVADELIDD